MRFSLTTRVLTLAVLAALAAVACAGDGPSYLQAGANSQANSPRLSEQKTGTLETRPGLRLRLVTDTGNVHVRTDAEAAQVRYQVRVETDARQPDARELLNRFTLTARSTPSGVEITGRVPWHEFRGRLWVEYEVSVPLRYTLDVKTDAGNIDTEDIQGRVRLMTGGGNISAGSVDPPETPRGGGRGSVEPAAWMETGGGHIRMQDVSGDTHATTGGGHITAGRITGSAVLETGGGHIRVRSIAGMARLQTAGGNISVERAGGSVTAATGGGQITFGEAAGAIHARTGGGGIDVVRVSGPLELASGGGSIFLTQVQNAVRASTNSGTITAWFTPESRLSGASQLLSGQGDIVVYLPRELAVTIEATIEMAKEHRIEADPSLPVKISYLHPDTGGRVVRGECTLNGGGQVLRLKTTSGNILLKYSDTDPRVRLNQGEIQRLQKRLEIQQRVLSLQMEHSQQVRTTAELEARVREQLAEAERMAAQSEQNQGMLEQLSRRLEQMWLGGIRVDPKEQQTRLIHQVRPEYPDVARQAGIEGTVRLRILVGEDGSVHVIKVLSGEPALARAAVDAVQQWRYRPTLFDGKPVSVLTTVAIRFRLR